MCLAIFKNRPIKGIKHFVLFIRDENLNRRRSRFKVHFNPSNRILCGLDYRSGGTWLGVNLNTGNYGFVIDYLNKKFIDNLNPNYSRGMLLLNFLKENRKYQEIHQYKEYLNCFLSQGDRFNGTNILLSNFPD